MDALDQLLKRIRNGEDFLDNENIPYTEREKWLPMFIELINDYSKSCMICEVFNGKVVSYE